MLTRGLINVQTTLIGAALPHHHFDVYTCLLYGICVTYYALVFGYLYLLNFIKLCGALMTTFVPLILKSKC